VKIAVLCGHYPYSGAGVVAYESARELSRRHQVTFVHGGERDGEWRDGALSVISLELPPPAERRRHHLYWNPALIRKLKGVLERLAPDVIHFHIIQRQSFSLASLLLSRRHRAVWTLHDQWHLCVRSVPEPPHCEGMRHFCALCSSWPGLSLANKLLKEAVYAASRLEVIVPSRWLAELTGTSLLGRKPMHLVYNGIDLDQFRPPHENPVSSRPLTLLFVSGPNDPTKGLAELLQAYGALRAKHPALRLRIVGSAPDGARRPGVEVLGEVPRSRMPEAYAKADLFILPTLADNTPVTLMEAMACGLPVVATEVGGIPELVERDVTGRLVPRGDVAALAGAIESIAGDEGARRSMARAGRARAVARFSKQRMALELERIYEGMPGIAQTRAVEPAPAIVAGGER